MFLSILLFVIILLTLHYIAKFKPFRRDGIENPIPLPLIGNLNLMNLKAYCTSLLDLSLKYGQVYRIFFQGTSNNNNT